ncbi:hypothetical protein ARMGADRAFT_186315 [Armillaria gallica]|uniref:Uncharacterized protein n=1 Tax=Armillaria gallica TaxID=47427 RepID=A0A2H3DJV3_ARMGA|nr:hypothetical protein ARMGADRAFT_186315 [Armillaria gallica]
MSEDQASFNYLGAVLNQAILGALCHSIYTCILSLTLWSISNKHGPKPEISWPLSLYYRTSRRQSSWHSTGLMLSTPTSRTEKRITSGINTDIADAIMIWRCWIVWGRRWIVVILPILLFFGQGVFGCFALHVDLHETSNWGTTPGKSEVNWTTMYLSFSLGTTLLCTALIIYRIVTVRRSPDGISAAARAYRGIVEILVESALLYAVSLILFIVLIARGGAASAYPQIIYITTTGIAPTLIVARVASGQARPNDNWQASNVSALQFGLGTERTQTDGILSTSGREIDLEHGEPNHYD